MSVRLPSDDDFESRNVRAALLASIRVGDSVSILVPAGLRLDGGIDWKRAQGRAVIVSPGHVALNLGGRYGRPGVATVENLVAVIRRKG